MIVNARRILVGLYWRVSRLPTRLLPLHELCNLFVDGTTVDSYADEKLVLRTVIQLDGDIMTFVMPLEPSSQIIHNKHWKRVGNRLATISNQLNGMVRLVTWPIGLSFFVITAAFTFREFSPHTWGKGDWIFYVAVNVILPLFIGAIGHVSLVRNMIGKLFIKTVRRWLGQHNRHARIDALLDATRKHRKTEMHWR